jgi:hypothetical protein
MTMAFLPPVSSLQPPAWVRRIAAIASILCPLTVASAAQATRFSDSACIAQHESAASDACERLASEISHDINAVRALGRELEAQRRYADAATAYRVALASHPNHRDLMQRLIYARGQARSMNLLSAEKTAPTTPVKPPQTAPIASQLPPAAAVSEVPATAQSQDIPLSPPQQETVIAQNVASPPARYLALVIGNEQYADFEKLRTPLTDAHALAALLGRDYGFNVTVLPNATRYQIVSALSRLRQEATENDSVLIYYAGHGYLDDATSRGYWLPVDAEHDNMANWLSTSDITDVLAGLQARHALILADSCFSGTLLRSGAAVAIDERQALLRKLSTRRSRNIMTSGGLEPVVDNGAGQHSIFAEALLGALRENRQSLEAGRLFMQIRDQVSTRAEQTPQYAPLRNAGHEGGDFVFEKRRREAGGG